MLFPVPRFPDSSFSVSLFRVTFLYDRARVRRVSAQRRYAYFFNKCKRLFSPFFIPKAVPRVWSTDGPVRQLEVAPAFLNQSN